jgi:hypothetical protein
MRQSMFRKFCLFMILTLISATTVPSNNGREVQPRKVSISSSQADNQIGTVGSQNESKFQSNTPGYWLVTDLLDGWGGESKSTGYGIKVSVGGQAGSISSSVSTNYKTNSGFIPAIQVKRGDVNENDLIDVGDVVYLINYLFRAGDMPIPLESGDCNCDGGCDVGDVVYLINYLFKQGLPPCGP